MKNNKHIQNAKYKKDDEFYTRFEDIEKELDDYDWSDKIVVPRGKGIVYFYERDKQIKLIEPYSVKNYFARFLLNYDSSKVKFFTKK